MSIKPSGTRIITNHGPSRRQFMTGTAAAALGGSTFLWAPGARANENQLFTLGVASGDPDDRSVVLWTRLAPDPLNGGGMGRRAVPVRWEVATDYDMRHVIRRGITLATHHRGHAVQAVARGLPSDCWLYYRFYALGQASRVGRTRTFPSSRDVAYRMRFALASCQNYTAGFYSAYNDMLNQDLDFVVHVGDYIYENAALNSPLLPDRNHNGSEIFSVEDYRNRYALYRLDPNLQEAHAQLPFIATWDDHEVDNNYAGLVPEEGAPFSDEFAKRRRNGYQVYAESMPLRPWNRLLRRDGSLRIFRKLKFGQLADIHVLDSRQFRTDQPAEDGFGSADIVPPAVEAALEGAFGEELFDPEGINDPSATMLGAHQETWLARNLRRSRAQWNILAQGIMVTKWNLVSAGRLQISANPTIPPADKEALLAAFEAVSSLINVDAWDGYQAARERLFGVLDALRPSNPVVLTGDIHSSWAANLLKDFANPSSDVLAAEFVCTSITSTFGGADPRPTDFVVRSSLADNPHIEFFNGLFRGYCVCDVDTQRWQTTFRAVGSLADTQNPAPDALVPKENSTLSTDAVVEIPSGFNKRGETQKLVTQSARIPV